MMITDFANQQVKWAEERYKKDSTRRNERNRQLVKLREKRSWDQTRVDDEERILVRAKVLGMENDLLKKTKSEVILERILQGRDLLPGDFLRVGAMVSAAVGRIHVRDQNRSARGFGTGFMISDRLMMTNNHVLNSASDCINSLIEFDYIQGLLDSAQRSIFFTLDYSTFFVTSATLDYTIIALAPSYDQQQAQRRGWLRLIPESGKLIVGERVNIVQHPRGGHQEVGLRQNILQSVDGDYLIYSTDTEPGSSGSPVCNDQWQLAALHHAGVPKKDERGVIIGWLANEGVRISSIVRDVRKRLQNGTDSANELFEASMVEGQTVSQASVLPSFSAVSSSLEIPIRLSIQLGSGQGVATDVTTTTSATPPTPQTHSKLSEDKKHRPLESIKVFSNPRLECIVTRIAPDGEAETIFSKRARNWQALPIDKKRRPFSFDLVPPANKTINVADAWDMVHKLRADKDIIQAEPSWEIDMVLGEERNEDERESFLSIKTAPDRAAETRTWAPELIGVKDAWKVPPKGGKKQGEGIRVAHPDSGYTKHAELWERPDAIDILTSKDFVDPNKPDALDEDGFHGTGTASVLISSTEGDILGVAPKATLVPMRVAQQGLIRPAPVISGAGTRHLRDAIRRAIKKDCHVISISLGWLGNSELQAAVREAWDENLIIVSAAGNYTGRLIVWPARYPECICMAGCDSLRGIWEGSARGERVDFTGPGQDVWKAWYDKDGRETVTQSSGTSFAVAMTAGVAALWLAFHGRENLLKKYGPHNVRLAEVFRTVMKRSVDPPPRYLFGGFGGIINAKRALLTELPDPGEVRKSFGLEAFTEDPEQKTALGSPSLISALEIIGGDYASGRRYLADLFLVNEDSLDKIADGCGDELAFHAILNQANPDTLELEGFRGQIRDKSNMSRRLSENLEKSH
jgi:thermitase